MSHGLFHNTERLFSRRTAYPDTVFTLVAQNFFDRYLRRIGKSWAAGDYMYLLSKKRIIDLCRETGAQNVTIKGNRLFGFVMDYSVIIT